MNIETARLRIARVVTGMPTSDGAGVRLTRLIGTPQLDLLDPFLMLDEFGTDRPQDYLAGFPDHPHRGFETVTYMLDGRMRHRDNHGNEGLLVPGSVQWMTAGRGLVHSEMPEQQEGRMRGFQLWVNLPARDKMVEPRYQEFAPDLAPGAAWTHALPSGHAGFAYVYEGAADAGADARRLERGQLGVLEGAGELPLRAGDAGARLLVVAGRPLREPVARYGPFVMNTREELQQAFADYQAGRF